MPAPPGAASTSRSSPAASTTTSTSRGRELLTCSPSTTSSVCACSPTTRTPARSPRGCDPRQLHVRRAPVASTRSGRSATGSSGGGRWVALHGTNAALDLGGRTASTARAFPAVGRHAGQPVRRPPADPAVSGRGRAPDHWLVAGIEPFETDDELYLSEYHDRARSCRCCTPRGRARQGFRRVRLDQRRPATPRDVPAPARRRRGALQHARPLPGPLRHGAGPRLLPARRTLLVGPARRTTSCCAARCAGPAAQRPEHDTADEEGPRWNCRHEVQLDLHRGWCASACSRRPRASWPRAAKLPGFLHLYVGEEAVAAGVCAALNDDDHITSTHRGHGHLVAKGGDFNRMMAELMGKSTGYCKGKGGSMHISDLDARDARRQRHRRRRRRRSPSAPASPTSTAAPTRSPSPSSATARPTSAPSTRRPTWPCALHLPVVFVCENNEYGEFTPRDKTMAITDIVDRAAGYGMPGVIVDGMDVVAVHEAAAEAVARARARRRAVADRGQDVPLLQPPRHPEPRAQVPHRRRGRGVEGSATRSSRSRSG